MRFYLYGAVPDYCRKESDMSVTRLSSIYKILNKKAIPYEIDGKSGTSYRVTVSQNDDADVLEEKVSKQVFENVEKGKVYCFWGTKRILRDGNIRISYDYVEPILDNAKAMTK